jgi:integrase
MHPEVSRRRQYGTGSVYAKRGSWYGQWRPQPGAKQVNRALGKRRAPGGRDGLTRKQAEAKLRELMGKVQHAAAEERLTVAEAGARYLHHLTGLGRKRSTLMDYESTLRVHLGPYFGRTALDRIGPEQVEAFMAAKAREGRAPKSVLNYVGLLHSIFEHVQRRGWASANPCKLVDKPSLPDDHEIRFLDTAELEALLRAVPEDRLGMTERALYLTAAMTGLRQGELLALRWLDIDWLAGRVRVRRNFVRGQFGTPKTLRSSRSVPLADRVAAALELHSRRSAYQADDDLVFCHPDTGRPLDRSKLLKRFKAR